MEGNDKNDEGSSTVDLSGFYGYHGHHHHGSEATIGLHDVVDPVCGKSIDPHLTQHSVDHDGERLYFCSSACQSQFNAEPARYL